jgi:hypothetical protein
MRSPHAKQRENRRQRVAHVVLMSQVSIPQLQTPALSDLKHLVETKHVVIVASGGHHCAKK